jgi:hypothetical protein
LDKRERFATVSLPYPIYRCIRLELNSLKRIKNVSKNGQKMAEILPNIVAIPVVLQFAYLTQPAGIQSFLDFLQSISYFCMIFAGYG